jgi:hypothetical protein
MGDCQNGDVRVRFDRTPKLSSLGSKASTDAGLLAYRERDDGVGPTTMDAAAVKASRYEPESVPGSLKMGNVRSKSSGTLASIVLPPRSRRAIIEPNRIAPAAYCAFFASSTTGPRRREIHFSISPWGPVVSENRSFAKDRSVFLSQCPI